MSTNTKNTQIPINNALRDLGIVRLDYGFYNSNNKDWSEDGRYYIQDGKTENCHEILNAIYFRKYEEKLPVYYLVKYFSECIDETGKVTNTENLKKLFSDYTEEKKNELVERSFDFNTNDSSPVPNYSEFYLSEHSLVFNNDKNFVDIPKLSSSLFDEQYYQKEQKIKITDIDREFAKKIYRDEKFPLKNNHDIENFKSYQEEFNCNLVKFYDNKGEIKLKSVSITIGAFIREDKIFLSHIIAVFATSDNYLLNPTYQVLKEKIAESRYRKEVESLGKKIKKQSIKSAIAAIMSRQMSHNLGSHVIPGTRYDIKKVFPEKKDIAGIDRLLQYLQERMDFISMIVNTDESEKLYGALNLKAHILDELAMDGPAIRHNKIKNESSENENATTNYILRHIVKSEGYFRFENVIKSVKPEEDDSFKIDHNSEHKPIEFQIIQLQKLEYNNKYKYQKFTSVSNGDIPSSPFSKTDFAIPYGVNGRHAFLNVLEDFIRNSAKHGKDKLKELKSLVFTILVQTKANFEENNIEEVGEISNLNIKDQLEDDEFLVSIFCNKQSDKCELAEIKESFTKLKLLNEDGSINQENKGLKEIMICLAWLKNKMSDLSIIENQICNDNFLELNQPNYLGDYSLIKNPIIPDDKDHLALRFTLKKYRFAYIITLSEFDKYFKGDELKYDEIFKLPSSEIYVLDDSKIKNTKKIIKLKKSIPKLIELSRIIDDEKDWGEFNDNPKTPFSEYIKEKIDDINSTKEILSVDYCTTIMKSYIKMKYRFSDKNKYPLMYIIRNGKNEYDKNENKDLIIRTNSDDFSEITKQLEIGRKALVFRNHNDEQDQYKDAYNGLKNNMPDFMEGISGNNFTYNLVISNVISELEYYKILDSSLTKIAIIDERIFEHHAKKNNQKIIPKKNKVNKNEDVWKVEFVKMIKDDTKSHDEILSFLVSNNILMNINTIIDFQNDESFTIEDLKSFTKTNNTKFDIFSGKNIFLFDMFLNDESLKKENADINYSIYNSEGIIQTDFSDYDYISVHFGLIEKYKPTEYPEIKERFKMFKSNVLKIDLNSNIKLTIHSGRGNLTNLDDEVRYLPVSSIESQLTNCKHLLTQQFANVKYKI